MVFDSNDKVFGHFQLIIVIPSWTQELKGSDIRQSVGETERQRDRKTERQKDRKTEKQEVRETERPRDD